MSRRILLYALVLSLTMTGAAAEKRRSAIPGAARCAYGTLAGNVWIELLALDATHIYFFDSSESMVMRVPRQGGPAQELAVYEDDLVFDIAVDDTSVYVATIPASFEDTLLPGTIYAVPKGGGPARSLATGVVFPAKLRVDATHVFWVSAGTVTFGEDDITILADGKVERVRKDGGGREALASGLSAPLSLAVDATDVYFSESGDAVGNQSRGIRRMSKAGGVVRQLDNQYIAAELEESGGDLVFYGGTSDFDEVGIYRLSKEGGRVQTLVEDEGVSAGPRIHDGQVYYVTFADEFTDALMRVPFTGGPPEFLGVPFMTEYDFEVDDCGIIYGTIEGDLIRRSK